MGLIYETNVRPKIVQSFLRKNLELINMDVSGGN